jgi:hypothetical protein
VPRGRSLLALREISRDRLESFQVLTSIYIYRSQFVIVLEMATEGLETWPNNNSSPSELYIPNFSETPFIYSLRPDKESKVQNLYSVSSTISLPSIFFLENTEIPIKLGVIKNNR